MPDTDGGKLRMSRAIVSLSFDDGREDTYRIACGIMKKNNLLGTLHAATGYVDGTWKNNSWKTSAGPMTIAQLKELSEYGFEIASHGDKHITDINDLKTSIRKLTDWNVIGNRVGFSIPCSRLSEPDKTSFTEEIKTMGVAYMRGGRSTECYTLISKIYFLLYSATKTKVFYGLFNRQNCIDIKNCSQYDLPSVVIRYGDKADVITDFIRKNAGSWIILMLHGIQNKSEDTYGKDPWCWDAVEFEKLCRELKSLTDEGLVSVYPIIEVVETLCNVKDDG